MLYVLAYPSLLIELFDSPKFFLITLPLYALFSTLWSSAPDVTLRASLQNVLVVIFSGVITKSIAPRKFIDVIFISVFVVVIFSLIVNNRVSDGDTGQINWSGIYRNKNSMSAVGFLFGLCCVYYACDKGINQYLRLISICMIPLSYLICYAAKSVAILAALTISIILMLCGYFINRFSKKNRRSAIENHFDINYIFLSFGGICYVELLCRIIIIVGKSPTLTGRTVLWQWRKRSYLAIFGWAMERERFGCKVIRWQKCFGA